MSGPLALLPFQEAVAAGLLARLEAARDAYDALPPDADAALARAVAKNNGAAMLYAPTGAGKTLLAAEVLARFDPGVWLFPQLCFWPLLSSWFLQGYPLATRRLSFCAMKCR